MNFSSSFMTTDLPLRF